MEDLDARALLEKLTTSEKIALVLGTGMSRDFLGFGGRVPGAAGATLALPELGLVETVHADGPAGVRIAPKREDDERTFYATAFPIATALACSFDVELLEAVGRAMGEEALEYGVDFLLGPAMNIHRNPLTGRNFEYLSEDPLLSGRAAAALVRGIQSTGVAATIKHFAANNTETSRFVLDTVIAPRALREIYLRGFEIAIEESQPAALMSAYNRINGQYASQSVDLLETILREDWGFDGIVMTDWFSGDSAVEQVIAGNDLLMPGTEGQMAELEYEADRSLPREALDRNVLRILRAVLATPTARGYNASEAPDLPAHAVVARRAGAEGAVMLANQDALPISGTIGRLAVFGNTSYDLISGGTGSGDVNEAYTVSMVEGLRAAELDVDQELEARYLEHLAAEKARIPERPWFLPQERPQELVLDDALVERKASEAGVALVTIGRLSGEFEDRKLEGDFLLTDSEHELIDRVSRAFHEHGKNVIVVLNIGNVIEMASWRDKVDAIVVPWQGGQEAGHAIADVLTGRVNPSGRLVTTIPIRYEDLAVARNFPGVETSEEPVDQGWVPLPLGRPASISYEEGIYVGYRFMDAFGVDPAFPFGFGLSYTSFRYGDAAMSDQDFSGSSIEVSLDITNVGGHAGREVVQCYLEAPAGASHKPPRELGGFAKTAELAPGGTERVSIVIDQRELMSFDETRSAWVADAGQYVVRVGSSSRDLRVSAVFELRDELVVPVLPALPLREQIEEIAPPLR